MTGVGLRARGFRFRFEGFWAVWDRGGSGMKAVGRGL